MTTKNNKSIILLYPPYGPESHELTRKIINNCKKHKLSVIKHLQAKGPFDAGTLIKLLKVITKQHKFWPINIIIDKALCKSPDYILAAMTLDILSTTGLIKICTYEKSSELNFHFLEFQESCALVKAAKYMKNLTAFAESKINQEII